MKINVKIDEKITDLDALVREAGMVSLRENILNKEVLKKHFDEALKKINPSVTPQSIETYKKIESQFLDNAHSAVIQKEGSYLG